MRVPAMDALGAHFLCIHHPYVLRQLLLPRLCESTAPQGNSLVSCRVHTARVTKLFEMPHCSLGCCFVDACFVHYILGCLWLFVSLSVSLLCISSSFFPFFFFFFLLWGFYANAGVSAFFSFFFPHSKNILPLSCCCSCCCISLLEVWVLDPNRKRIIKNAIYYDKTQNVNFGGQPLFKLHNNSSMVKNEM